MGNVRKSLKNLGKDRGIANTEVAESLDVSAVEVRSEEMETLRRNLQSSRYKCQRKYARAWNQLRS